MEVTYNCWHGCHKKSEGCMHCYVYRRDESIGKDANIVYKTASFNMPVRFISANKKVHTNSGRVAIMRGPVV